MTDQRKYISKLAGKHVLIIGGSAGIGYGVAEASLEHGAAVTISSSNAGRLAAAVDALSAAYPTAAREGRISPGVVCDLGAADDDALDANAANLFATITSRPSPTGDSKTTTTTTTIDHIVYSAGDALATIPLASATTARVRRAGTVRFFGALACARAATQVLPPNTLSSFTITSGTVAHRPLPGWAVVGGFATGLLGMTRSLALDLAPARIRVNCVAPGAVDTGLWDGFVETHNPKITAGRKLAAMNDALAAAVAVAADRDTIAVLNDDVVKPKDS
ncbi:hypothetical protein SLS55_007356 [Diplodia seriata]|uniref:Short chain dehydrogenase n=1 Tax=Diplodia seriata TaxID=420778 RepID=A0ABR3CCC8_9PEZI